MAIFINPRGRSTFGIGICARCSEKMSLDELYSDPNSPGLMVCKKDLDDLDPYRLPARQPDKINLDFVRPDLPLAVRGLTAPRLSGILVILSPTFESADLSWIPGLPGPNFPLERYDLYRSLNGGAFSLLISLPISSLIYSDAGIVSGNTYSYLIRVVDFSETFATSNTIILEVPFRISTEASDNLQTESGDNLITEGVL